MSNNQLPLFDWQTTIMGEGYRHLKAFKFEEAMQHFKDAIYSGLETDKEVIRALQACKYWQPLMPHNGEPIGTIYQKFCRFDFGHVSGLQQFKYALLKHIVNEMLEADIFYLNDGKIVSDLLMDLRHYEKAEEIVIQKMGKHPDDCQLIYFLSQIQWQSNKRGEAKKNFALALLSDPCCVPSGRIEYRDLHTLIEDVGAEMASAYGWVRGVLPLVSLPEDIKVCSEVHRKAIDCYYLLKMADKAAVKNKRSMRLEYRKKLYAQAPVLYEEYFKLFSG